MYEVILAVAALLSTIVASFATILPLVSDRANQRAVRLAKARRRR